MNCIEGKALGTSFHPEMAIKSSQQAFSDEFFSGNGINVISGDDFSIEDLLDFSNEDVEEGFIAEDEGKISISVSSQERTQNDYSNSRTFPVDEDFSSVPILTSELSFPAEDIADLEWLSNFVEDSFSEFSLIYQAGNSTENRYESEIEAALMKIPCFPTKIPVKARSKRSRAAGRVWSIGSPSLTESSSTSSSSSSNSSSSASSLIGKPPSKKQKKKPATESGGSHLQRRCCHCHVQKTPQWRAGPLGAKTLCNACGVRYKSGRLWPEYRPACSPTFSGEIHSNSHRKVLEMRSNKQRMTAPEYGSPVVVQSF